MAAFEGIRRVLRIGVVQRELDDELDFHFELTVEELMRTGKSRGQAEEEARGRFGDERRWRRELLRIDRGAAAWTRWIRRGESLTQAVTHAFRRIRRAPGFALGVILTFGLGIGANATMFGVVDRLLLSPPPHIADAESLKRIMVERFVTFTGTREVEDYFAYPDYLDWTRASSFSSVAAYANRDFQLGRGETAREIEAQLVTGSYWRTLGTAPLVGRFFGPAEDRPGGPEVAVISHGMWKREFGGDPEVLGRTLDFGYGPYTIIGVAPEGFTGVDLARVDAWFPMVSTRLQQGPTTAFETRNNIWLRVVARLKPGVSAQEAGAEATTLHLQGRMADDPEREHDRKATVMATPLILSRGPQASEESVVAKWLAGISLIVLLIACANVANLLLARAVRQRREVGIRLALGSSRARVLGQVLTESLLLAVLGGVAALLVTRWGGALLRSVLLPDVEWGEAVVETRVAAVIFALALLAGVVSGVIPALQTSRPDLTETLKSSSRSASGNASSVRNALTVLQAALSVILLVGAGLFVRSLQRVENLDMGFDPKGVLLFSPVFTRGTDAARENNFILRASERLDEIPGVAAASPDHSVPFYSMSAVNLRAPDLDSIPRLSTGSPGLHQVEHDYFEVMGLELRRGRPLLPTDVRGSEPVMVIDETMARTLWPGQEALGKCLIVGGSGGGGGRRGDAQSEPAPPEPPCTRIVGIVEDSRRFELRENPTMNYFMPLAQARDPQNVPAQILVRVEGDAAAMIPTLRREMLALEPGLRYAEFQLLEEMIAPSARSWTLGAAVFTAFGFLALVVAGIGLYSVLAFNVAQRTFELGIRAALGATRQRLVHLVLRQALGLAGTGIVLGSGVALLAARRLEPMLFEVSARDPLTYAVVVVVLCVVAAVAGSLPAWRATRVDPSVALRTE